MKLLDSNKENLKNKLLNFRCSASEKSYIIDLCQLIAEENDLKNKNFSTVVRFLFDSYEPKYFDKNKI